MLLSEKNHCHISSLRAAVFCANLSARSHFFAACIAQEQCEKRWSLSSVLAGQGYLSPVISRGGRGLVIPFFLQMVSCYMAAGKCRPHISLYLKKHRDLKKILDCKDFLLFCDFSVTRDFSGMLSSLVPALDLNLDVLLQIISAFPASGHNREKKVDCRHHLAKSPNRYWKCTCHKTLWSLHFCYDSRVP